MFKRNMKVLMELVAVLMLPLSAWAVNPPQGSVNDVEGVIIKGGYCEVHPKGSKVDMTIDSSTGRWSCEGLEDMEGKDNARVRV